MGQVLEQAAEPYIPSDRVSPADRGWRGHWPFLAAAALYVAACVVILGVAVHLASGHFVYPLDDVYIHMAVAKNLALHGVWGATRYEFSSCTSSPLWVLLLAGVFKVLGPNEYVPLAFSWIFGLGALWVAAKIVEEEFSAIWQAVVLGTVVLLTPMFLVGTMGMEHSLQLLLTLLFLRHFQSRTNPLWLIGLIAALMVGTRYEGLLMTAVAGLILLLQRRYVRAVVIGVCGAVPVAGYAVLSIGHGGYWLPNSVALKGVKVDGAGVSQHVLNVWHVVRMNLERGPHLALLVGALLLMAVVVRKERPALAEAIALIGGSGLLHLLTADVGWAFRYESYLVAAGLLMVACAWRSLVRSKKLIAIGAQCLFYLCFGVLLIRGGLAGALLPRFSRAIYLQQWQMARFLKTAYPGGSVAANDIGAIDYQTDLHCLDLSGLASAEIFQAKQKGYYTTDFLGRTAAAHGVQVAVVYDSWYATHPATEKLGGPPLPGSWIRVARWSVPEKQQLGDRTVSFYALNPAEALTLKSKLEAFAPSLPRQVTVGQ